MRGFVSTWPGPTTRQPGAGLDGTVACVVWLCPWDAVWWPLGRSMGYHTIRVRSSRMERREIQGIGVIGKIDPDPTHYTFKLIQEADDKAFTEYREAVTVVNRISVSRQL
jgi:hypothetical protein